MAADIYTSLEGAPGAIRILILLPGSSDEELECQLEETSLGADPSYVALSHVWDNYIDSGLDGRVKAANFAKVFVRCNGRLVPISANLYSALRRLRDKLNPVRLWVDMLCIDQDDIEERNHQVTLMRQIYERSQEVIIWLGDIFPDSFDHQEFFAFALISRLAAGAHIISQGVFHSLVFTHDDGKISTGISELTQMMSMAWVSFCRPLTSICITLQGECKDANRHSGSESGSYKNLLSRPKQRSITETRLYRGLC